MLPYPPRYPALLRWLQLTQGDMGRDMYRRSSAPTRSAEIGLLTVLQKVADPQPLRVVHRQLIDLLRLDEP